MWRSVFRRVTALVALLAVSVLSFTSSGGGDAAVAKQDVVVELFYSGVWNEVPVYTRTPIRITHGQPSGEGGGVIPSTVSLTLDDREGLYDPSDPLSPLFGLVGRNTPIRIILDTSTRFYGEVVAYRPDRSVEDVNLATGRGDAWVEINAAGQLHRIGQGADLKLSALFRSMIGISAAGYVPVAYWPMEDGSQATQFAPALPGGTPMTFSTGISAGLVDTLPGSLPLPEIGEGVHLVGDVPSYADAGQWVVQSVAFVPSDLVADGVTVGRYEMTDGSSLTVGMVNTFSGDFLQVVVRDSTDTVTNLFEEAYDQTRVNLSWTSMVVASQADMSGTTDGIHVSLYDLTGDLIASISELITATSHKPIDVIFPGGLETSQPDGTSYGHYGVYIDAAWTLGVDDVFNAQAAGGWDSETAADRFARLCTEDDITYTVSGTAADSQPMGAQPPATILELFAEIARTDDAIIHDQIFGAGIVMRTRRAHVNQTAALELTFPDDIAPPLRRVVDDLKTRNDVTASKSGGSSARAVLETGPLSVLAPPDGVGRTTGPVDVNPELDATLMRLAEWYLAKGTVPDPRYPQLKVDLVATPDLVAAVDAVRVGDLLTVAGVKEGTARLLTPGWTEIIGSHTRTVEYNTTPEGPYRSGVYGPASNAGLWAAGSSTLATAVTATSTTWSVATTSLPLWGTSAAYPSGFPVRIKVGGLTYNVTAISGASSPQTFTVTRLGAGRDKTHPAGTPVTVVDALIYAI